MISNREAIFNSWQRIPKPKQNGNFEIFQYLKTNLWVLKNSNGGFGFLITDTISQLSLEYKNIHSHWKRSLKNNNGQILNLCLIIESNDLIDSKLFCSAISSLFEIKDKNYLFKINEIEEALRKIEEITLKESDAYNEVIGVWGELYLINELLKHTSNANNKIEIIESWESAESRSVIDLNIKSKKTKIEVKTTTESIRIHHFNGLGQVTTDSSQKGFLASLCIIPDDNGLSCLDLVKYIEDNIPSHYLTIVDKKLRIRGEVCRNNKFHFSLTPHKTLEFFDFDEVPKPTIEDGVGKITWEATLENKQHLDGTKKHNLLNIMN
jgi:hypothetical protein